MLCEGLLITFVVFLVSFKFLPSLFLEIMGSHKVQFGSGRSRIIVLANQWQWIYCKQYKTVHRTGESQMTHWLYGMTKVH